MPPQPKPNQKPTLTKTELDAQKAADAINDNENPEFKLAMRKECRELEKIMKDEEALLSLYQQERQKINSNWIISKKQNQDFKSEFINKERELQDLKENHIMTLNIYKQKIKHLLFQNQDQQSELRKDVEVTLKQLEDEHRTKERELKTDNRTLKVQIKEQELSQMDYIFAIKSEFDRRSTALRQDYERTANDIKKKYDLKMLKLRQQMEQERNTIIKHLEQKKDAKIQQITKEHASQYSNIKNYYSDITITNLDLIKQLKNEIAGHLKSEARDNQYLTQIEKEFKNLSDPLQQLIAETTLLEQQFAEQSIVQEQKQSLKNLIELADDEFRQLEYEYEVKLQHFKYLQHEKEELYDKFNQAVYEIHQKTGLNNLILEQKVNNLKQDLEIQDLQFQQILSSAKLDNQITGSINQSLDEVETLKNQLINELQLQLKQIRKAHSHMVKAYEGQLSEFVIPVQELGFDPLVPTNTD